MEFITNELNHNVIIGSTAIVASNKAVIYVSDEHKIIKEYLPTRKGAKVKVGVFIRFKSIESMTTYINEHLANIELKIKLDNEFKARLAKEQEDFLNQVEVGTILYSTWGWEQTNVDFYQVVGKKGKTTLLIKEINGTREYTQGYSYKALPLVGEFTNDEVITKRAKDGSLTITDFSIAKLLPFTDVDGEKVYNAINGSSDY